MSFDLINAAVLALAFAEVWVGIRIDDYLKGKR